MTAPQQPGGCACFPVCRYVEMRKHLPESERCINGTNTGQTCKIDTRQRNVPEGERMYAITEKHIETIHHLMTIPDHAWGDADYMMRDEVFEEIRSRPLSDMCMEWNGAQGQQPPACTQNHHNDDGTLIVYLGEAKPCYSCHDREPCFERLLSWRNARKEKKQAQPQDAAGKAEHDVILNKVYPRPKASPVKAPGDVLAELADFLDNPDNTSDFGNAKKGIMLPALFAWMQSKGWQP